LEIRRSHRDAESLELVGSGNTASVVVGENGNGASDETAVEHAFAGHKEVVAVDETDHFFGKGEEGNGKREMGKREVGRGKREGGRGKWEWGRGRV
jgi:hypothetical protein